MGEKRRGRIAWTPLTADTVTMRLAPPLLRSDARTEADACKGRSGTVRRNACVRTSVVVSLGGSRGIPGRVPIEGLDRSVPNSPSPSVRASSRPSQHRVRPPSFNLPCSWTDLCLRDRRRIRAEQHRRSGSSDWCTCKTSLHLSPPLNSLRATQIALRALLTGWGDKLGENPFYRGI